MSPEEIKVMVNGVPLKEFLDKEKRSEILTEYTHSQAEKAKTALRRPIKPKFRLPRRVFKTKVFTREELKKEAWSRGMIPKPEESTRMKIMRLLLEKKMLTGEDVAGMMKNTTANYARQVMGHAAKASPEIIFSDTNAFPRMYHLRSEADTKYENKEELLEMILKDMRTFEAGYPSRKSPKPRIPEPAAAPEPATEEKKVPQPSIVIEGIGEIKPKVPLRIEVSISGRVEIVFGLK